MSIEEVMLAAEELPVAIWMGRVPSGELVYANAAFREVLGMDAPPDPGRGSWVEPYGVRQLDGQPYPNDKMPYERALAARASVVVDDIVIHRRDGRKVNIRVFAKPLFDEHGTLTHVVEAFTDITREVEAEAARAEGERRLARAQRLESIGQLVAGIAHDFNNLLTVTKLVVSRLCATERDDQRRTELRDVDNVTDSAIGLVRNLLDFAGRTRAVRVPIDMDSVVGSVVGLAQRTFGRRITVTTALHGGWILGDRSQLEQVLMNLLVNARDAIAGTGSIELTTRVCTLAADEIEGCKAGDYVVIEVSDDGVGIAPAIRERVFEPYFTTKDVGPNKGTGLGLATVHGIVGTHSGCIALVSPRAAGAPGTTMRLAFPQARPSTHVGRSVPPPIARPRARAARGDKLVILVEDEKLVREATSVSLTELGYRVVSAATGAQAVEVVRKHIGSIAAVVLDMVMPDSSARDIYSSMRALDVEVPVLLISASAHEDDVRSLLEDGVVEWLAKPFEPSQLAAAMARVTAG